MNLRDSYLKLNRNFQQHYTLHGSRTHKAILEYTWTHRLGVGARIVLICTNLGNYIIKIYVCIDFFPASRPARGGVVYIYYIDPGYPLNLTTHTFVSKCCRGVSSVIWRQKC